ncbi:MAG: hypothetical protein HFG30_07585 [Eubacterium sp.]|jgi:hypothetical protein|nr:hypothetical protein [Eubacterium sp.]
MKLKKMIVVLMMVVFVLESITAPVKASAVNVKIRVVSVKNKNKCVKVKVKISNNTKKQISYGNDFSLYKRNGRKWKKLKMKEGYGFDTSLNILFVGESTKKTFYIDKKAYKKKIEKNKRYMIKFRISGKKKMIKFKL